METIREPKTATKLHMYRRAFHHTGCIKPGMTVRCEDGLVWLTKSSDMRDYMLKPGASMEIGKRADVLIEALSEADVTILYPN